MNGRRLQPRSMMPTLIVEGLADETAEASRPCDLVGVLEQYGAVIVAIAR